MKKNNQISLAVVLMIVLFVASASPNIVYAGGVDDVPPYPSGQNPNPPYPSGSPNNPLYPSGSTGSGTFYLQNPLVFNSVGGLVQGFLEIFSYIVVLFAVLMLIWVGLQFVLAQGKPERMKELKNWLLWIVVGVAIVIGARIIVTVVINTLQATGAISPGVINNATNALQGRP